MSESTDFGNFQYFFSVIALDARDTGLELYNPSTHADGNGFSSIARPQLLHDVLDMNLYGLF